MSGKAQAGGTAAPECAGTAVDRILGIHAALVAFFSTSPEPIRDLGLRDPTLLERAIAHPFTGTPGKCAALGKPSALLQGMIDELPFHDGNVQTSFIALLLLLDEHGLVANRVSFDAFFEFFAALHNHRLETLGDGRLARSKGRGHSAGGSELSLIHSWLEAHTRPEPVRDHPMRCAELERLLARHGFHAVIMDTGSGKVLEIFRAEPGEKNRLFRLRGRKDPSTSAALARIPLPQGLLSLTSMREARTACGLDAASFYDPQARIDSFIRQYERLLVRLGRL